MLERHIVFFIQFFHSITVFFIIRFTSPALSFSLCSSTSAFPFLFLKANCVHQCVRIAFRAAFVTEDLL